MQIENRFWAKVNKGPGCWEWTANRSSEGYGQFSIGGRLNAAHRVASELTDGPIPAGIVLDHRCRNKGCVNPKHLDRVTQRENTIRGVGPAAINYRKTQCVHAHAYTPENTIINKDGTRRCRTCKRGYDNRRYYDLS